MTCPECKAEHTSEAKFCGNCGHSLTEQVVEHHAEQGEQQLSQPAPVQENRSNETVEQAKQFASGYFQFFKNALKSPAAIMKSGHIEVRNGITSLVLICFLFPVYVLSDDECDCINCNGYYRRRWICT